MSEEGCIIDKRFFNLEVTNKLVTNKISVSNFTSITTSNDVTVSGALTVDTDTLYVDDTNNRVGIGTTTVDNLFEVFGSSSPQCKFSYDADSFCTIAVADGSNTTFATGESGAFTISDATTFSSDITIGGNIIADANEAKSIFTDVTSNNITIGGSGSTVIVDKLQKNDVITSTNTRISDQLIELGNGRTGAPSGDAGIVIDRGDENNAFIGFDESADVFIIGTGTFTDISTGDLTITPGTLNIAALQFSGTSLDATIAELNLMDAATSATSTTLVDADRIVVNDDNVGMVQVALTDFETYFESSLTSINNVTSASSLVTVGALNSGSITSGFGTIDIGSSAITAGACTVTSIVLADSQTITFGTGSDVTMQYNGTDLVIDNTAVTGDTTIQLGTDTSATKFDVKNNTGTELFSIDGAGALSLAGTALTATIAGEVNDCCDGDTGTALGVTLLTTDQTIVNDGGTMKQVALSDFEIFMESNLDTLNSVTSASSLVTVGALASGSIASGFGTIATGNNITTTAKLGVGTTSIDTSAALEIDSTTGALLLPRMDTTQRDALTGVDGMIIYNTSDSEIQKYATSWSNVAPAVGGSSSTTTKLSVDVGASTYTPSTSDGIISHIEGGVTYTDNSTAGSGTATAALLNSFETGTLDATNASVTTTDAATVYISGAPAPADPGNMTITNAWALWVDAGDVRLDGNLGIGTGSIDTSAALEIDSTTGALLLPRMTVTQRNTLTPVNGMLIYNTSTFQIEKYENGYWNALHIHNGNTIGITDNPNFIFVHTNSDTIASLSEYDVFDEDSTVGSPPTMLYNSHISYTSSNGRFTVVNAGDYVIMGNLLIDYTTSGVFTIDINVNDVTQFAYDPYYDPSDDSPHETTFAIILTLAANDYVNITVIGDGEDDITVHSKSTLEMFRVGGVSAADYSASVMSLYRTADSTTTTAEFDAFATASVTTLTSNDITHDTSNGRFTVTYAGFYMVHVSFIFDVSSDNTITIDFNINDTTHLTTGDTMFQDSTMDLLEQSMSRILYLTAGDYINVTCDGTTTLLVKADTHIMITSICGIADVPDHISCANTILNAFTGGTIEFIFSSTGKPSIDTLHNITLNENTDNNFKVFKTGFYFIQVNIISQFDEADVSPQLTLTFLVNDISVYSNTYDHNEDYDGNDAASGMEDTFTLIYFLNAGDAFSFEHTATASDPGDILEGTSLIVFRLMGVSNVPSGDDMETGTQTGSFIANQAVDNEGRLRSVPKITYDYANDYLGIHKPNPSGPFHVKQINEDAAGDLADINESAIIIEHPFIDDTCAIGISGDNDLSFWFNLIEQGYLANASNEAALDFTGQHRNVLKQNNTFSNSTIQSNLDKIQGLIVSSTGQFINLNNTYKPEINEALPIVEITNILNDRRVFGVISGIEDENHNGKRIFEEGTFVSVFDKVLKNDNRYLINSLGEGSIWICNINGPLSNGDYISSSTVYGYGMKQNDNLLHNYTVAKITTDCKFSIKKIPKSKIKTHTRTVKKQKPVTKSINKSHTSLKLIIDEDTGRNKLEQKVIDKIFEEQVIEEVQQYDENNNNIIIGTKKQPKMEFIDVEKHDIIYDEHGNISFIYDTDQNGNLIYDYPLPTRFINSNGDIIESEDAYKKLLDQGQNVYIACFVGCTYHCG